MNLLTDEECETVRVLSLKPELTIADAVHGQSYYGVDKESNEEDIKLLESILIKWCPSLHSFCNFTQVAGRIRVLTFYEGGQTGFVGVHYLPLPNNEE